MKAKDNNYRKIEGILHTVPKLRIEIDNLKLDLEEIEEIMGIHGQSGNVAAGSSTYAFNSTVENEVIDRDETLQEKRKKINASISKAERKLKRIENNLRILSESEMLLVELKYFKNYTNARVCDVLDISDSGLTKRRKRIIVEKLMPLSW